MLDFFGSSPAIDRCSGSDTPKAGVYLFVTTSNASYACGFEGFTTPPISRPMCTARSFRGVATGAHDRGSPVCGHGSKLPDFSWSAGPPTQDSGRRHPLHLLSPDRREARVEVPGVSHGNRNPPAGTSRFARVLRSAARLQPGMRALSLGPQWRGLPAGQVDAHADGI